MASTIDTSGIDETKPVTGSGTTGPTTASVRANFLAIKTELGHAKTDIEALQGADTALQPLDATLTALAGVTTAADKLIYATGADAFSTTDITAAGRALLDDADAAAQRTTLGLGTAATQNTGTSGANVPLLNGNNTHSGTLNVSGAFNSLGIDDNASSTCLTIGSGTTLVRPGSVAADRILAVGVSGTNDVFVITDTRTYAPSGAAASVYIAKDAATSRSINASGTVNASGADYAEYETKRPDCGIIQKGDVIGFDGAGMVTDKYDIAVSFGIKSTDPCLVGGDSWGTKYAIGIDRPREPDGYALWVELGRDAYLESFAIYVAYEAVLSEFTAILEEARAKVDRIAYCGKVPCNASGAVSGYLVIPYRKADGGIGAECKPRLLCTDEELDRCVGRVRSVLADGRPLVAVWQP